ncbi:MAG: Nif11-like leader peptide family RiPP precursor, partial [Cyanobacteriota bacterium]
MAEADLTLFREKIRQLNAFLALSESDPALGEALRRCSHHDEVVALAKRHGFEIGRRWGEQAPSTRENHGSESTSLLGGTPPPLGQETVEVLLATESVRLERIHSCAASSAPGFW